MTSSINLIAAALLSAIFSSGRLSALNSPQDSTNAERCTPGLTGYS
ncbi:Uncharacterised protein [Vibrio cholerae]|nr:Uncharacterised protein [Vibrio cholerae]